MHSYKKISENYNPKTHDNQNELLFRVTEDDKEIGSVFREECHNETTKPYHRTTHVYLFDKQGNLFLSQRSRKKDTAAGHWTVSAAGHVKYGDSYEQTAEKEVAEELGIKVPLEMIDKLAIDYGSEREIIGIFAGNTAQIPTPNIDEVEQVKTFIFDDIVKEFQSGTFDLSGGSRDSFKHVIGTESLRRYRDKMLKSV